MKKDGPQKQKSTFFNRLLSGFLAVLLSLASNPLPSPAQAVPSSQPQVMDSSAALPASLGKIEERFKGGEKTVILIRDAHAIPEAQRSIYEIITHFQKQYGVPVVAVEGAAEQMDFRIFRSFPDKKLLKETFEEYFENGELTGTVAAAIFGDASASYVGIENWDLYEKGLFLYLSALDEEPGLLGRLAAVQKELRTRKEAVYSPRLLAVDQALAVFRGKEGSLGDVLKTLAAVKRPEPGTELAVMLEEMEKDPHEENGIEAEIKEITRRLETYFKSLKSSEENKQKLRAFSSKTQEYRISSLSSEAFALYLRETAQAEGIEISFSERLSAAQQRQKSIKEIEGTLFFDALENYAAYVKEELFRTAEERALDEYGTHLELLEKLAKLELSYKEWERLNSREAWPEGQSLGGAYNAHIAFYQNAGERDQIFSSRLSELLASPGTSSAVLVAGGFHTEGLIRRFREEGVSYILVMPQIRALPGEIAYREHMKGNVSWKDSFRVENGRINLYDAFVRGVRDRLLAKAGASGNSPNGHVLKAWRDQLVRDLAREGRITSVDEYAPYLDEAAGEDASDPLNRYRVKVRRFIDGLRELAVKGQFNEGSIAGLLRSAAIPEPFKVPAPHATVSVELFRSELRMPSEDEGGEEGINLPARIEGERGLTPAVPASLFPAELAVPEQAAPSGIIARIRSAVQTAGHARAIRKAKARIDQNDVDFRWMPNQFFRSLVREGPEVLIPVADYAFAGTNPEARAVFIFGLFSRRESPSGIYPYLVETLGKITAEDLAVALRIPDYNDDIVEHLLSFRDNRINGLFVELFDHPEVGKTVYRALLSAAEKHVGDAMAIFEQASRLETENLSETLAEFRASEAIGLHARHGRPSLAELLEMGELPFETNMVAGEGLTIIVTKGEQYSVTALFPGIDFRQGSIHNHPGKGADVVIFPSGYAVRRGGVYGSEEYGRGDLFQMGTTRHDFIVSERGVTQYYHDPAFSGRPVPHVMQLRFADGTTAELPATEVRPGRFQFDSNHPLLLDASGRPRSFRATGMLGPNSKAYGMTFVTWPQIIRRLARGEAAELQKFLPPQFMEFTRLKPGDAQKLAAWMRANGTPLSGEQAAALRALERDEAPRTVVETGSALVSVAAERALMQEIGARIGSVIQRAPAGLHALFGQMNMLFDTETQLENFLPIVFQEDYDAALGLARMMLQRERPETFRAAAMRGIAASAAFLTPADTEAFLRQGFDDVDSRVKEEALTLLALATSEADILPFFEEALRTGFQTSRIVSITGTSKLAPEIKKALFLRYVRTNEVYRGLLVDDFARDLMGYAPKRLFSSLRNAGLSSADRTDVLLEAYRNLNGFDVSALTNNPWGRRPFLLEEMNLEDADILRLIAELDPREDYRYPAQILRDMMQDPSLAPPAPPDARPAAGRTAAPEEAEAPSIADRVNAAADPDERRRLLLEWLEPWIAQYRRPVKDRYDSGRYRMTQELLGALQGLGMWELGAEFNQSLLDRLLSPAGVPKNERLYSDIANALTKIRLSPETALGYYRYLYQGGMELFRDEFDMSRGDPLFGRIVASSYLEAPQKRVILEMVLTDPLLTDPQVGHRFVGSWTPEETSLHSFTQALLSAKFSISDDLRMITRFPMFGAQEISRTLGVLQSLREGETIETLMLSQLAEAVRTRYPNAVYALNLYVKGKRDQVLRGEIPAETASAPGLASGAQARLPAPGTPGTPPADNRSELRMYAQAVALTLLDSDENDDALQPEIITAVANAGPVIVGAIETAAGETLTQLAAARDIRRAEFESNFRSLISVFKNEPVFIRHVLSQEEFGRMQNRAEEVKALIETIRSTVSQYEKIVVEVQFADAGFLDVLKGMDRPSFDNAKLRIDEANNQIVFHNEAFSNFSTVMQTPFEIGLSGELLTGKYGEGQQDVSYPQESKIAAGFFLAGLGITAARLAQQPLDEIVLRNEDGRYQARSQAVLEGFSGVISNLSADRAQYLAAARSA